LTNILKVIQRARRSRRADILGNVLHYILVNILENILGYI
jgi:hypothetical protein